MVPGLRDLGMAATLVYRHSASAEVGLTEYGCPSLMSFSFAHNTNPGSILHAPFDGIPPHTHFACCRQGHSAVVKGNTMFVFGGEVPSSAA